MTRTRILIMGAILAATAAGIALTGTDPAPATAIAAVSADGEYLRLDAPDGSAVSVRFDGRTADAVLASYGFHRTTGWDDRATAEVARGN